MTDDNKPRALTRIGRNGGTLRPFDPARGREAARKRWERYRSAAAAEVLRRVRAVASKEDKAIIDAAHETNQVAAVYGVLAGIQGERAYVERDQQSFRTVRSAIGADTGAPAAHEAADQPNSVGVSISLSADAARALTGVLALLAVGKREDVIEAETREVESE